MQWEVGSVYGKGVELKVVDKVGSGNNRSVNTFVKGIKNGFSVEVDGSGGWGVYGGVCTLVDSSDAITFGFDDGYDLGSYDSFFNSLNEGKIVGLLLDK